MKRKRVQGAEDFSGINEILEIISAAVYIVNTDWRLTYINHNVENHLHRTRDALCGAVLWDVFPDYKTTAVYENLMSAMQKRIPMCFETFFPDMLMWLELNIYPMSAGGLTVSFQDITKRKRIDNALLESEELLRTIIENSHDGINLLDLETGRYTFISPAQVELTGFSMEEIYNSTAQEAFERVHPEDRELAVVQQMQVAEGLDDVPPIAYRWKVKSGEYRWFSDSRKLVRNAEGRPVMIAGVSRDITEFKRAEEALNNALLLAENRTKELNAVINAIPDGLTIYDKDGNVQYINEVSRKIFESFQADKDQELTKRIVTSNSYALDGSNLARGNSPLLLSLTTGENVKDFVVVRGDRDNRTTYTSISCAPILSGNGDITGAVATHKDITVQKEAEKKLQKSEEFALALVEELKKADENKNEFLGMLSHEIRNPLASISIALSLLEHAAPDSEHSVKARDVIKRQTAQLTRLVDELLDMTRITRNMIELKKEPVELVELLARSAEDYKIQFERSGVDLEVILPSNSLYLEADPVRVTQVIGNLLHNTVKFTDKGGKALLKLTIDKRSREAAIIVQDNGRGIKPEHLPDIFKPFVQLDSSMDRSKGGLGLGLAIVKGIVELHGWSITAVSDGLEKGTQFIISLPLPAAASGTQEIQREGCNQPLNSLRIMIADDNTDLTEIIGTLLEYFGHEVAAVFNGNDVLEKAKEFHPHVILCDIGLPGMDGYEVARTIRNCKKFDGVYLIALSGYALSKDIERSLDAGFNRHIAKPVDIEELQKILQTQVNNRI